MCAHAHGLYLTVQEPIINVDAHILSLDIKCVHKNTYNPIIRSRSRGGQAVQDRTYLGLRAEALRARLYGQCMFGLYVIEGRAVNKALESIANLAEVYVVSFVVFDFAAVLR